MKNREIYSSCNPYRVEVAIDEFGPSLTRQEFADECDINNIMKRYEATGIMPLPGEEPVYFDCSSVPDNLQEAMQVMIDAENAFMRLPAVTRKEFDNDAVKFVEYASDPEHLGRMREWGLAPPEEPPEQPMRVEVVNPPAAPAAGSGEPSKR